MAGFDLSQLNDGQREVVRRLEEPLFVAAGAGSGKTFTLTARLVNALSEGSASDGGRYLRSIDEALVITFTEAAALEIKERVRMFLRRAGDDDPFLREESLKVDGAWISTIHSMCARILRRHAVELGIDPAFKVCEGSVADALMANALDEVMRDVQREDAYERLRTEYPVWSASQGPTSVVGMIHALRAEAAKCANGFDDFVCPHSDEVGAAMERLCASLEALASLKMTVKQRETAEQSLASVASFCELPPGERTAAHASEALAQVKIPALSKAEQVPLKEDAKHALAEATVCAEYERVQEFAPQLVDLARRVDELYGMLKRSHSYLDNDDLITFALRAVKGSPEVARDYAGRFRLVMIDEFQDTDAKQLELISLLSGDDACHLATVGDAQQSIYRFRGGDVEVFRARGRALPTSSHVTMDVNYRSDPAVLSLVERSCSDAGLLTDFLKLAADGWRSSSYTAVAEGSELPRVRIEVCSGGTAELMSATIASQLADRLASYRDAGQPQGSMALLLGTTTRVGLYLDALRARGLQAVVTGGSSFTSAAEVGVIQALVHTLANPRDTETGLFRLLSSDLFRLDADDFCQLGTRAQDLLDAPTKRAIEQCFIGGELALFGDAEPSPRLKLAFEVLQRAFSRLGRWQLADVCQAVVDESGWLVRLERQGIDGLSVAANVLAAVRYVRELTVELGLGASRAAEEFDRWLEAAKLTPANLVGDTVDAVKVMTIHGSKGLQFAVTAVAECWGNPSVSGKLSFGRLDGRCVVCAAPKSGIKEFSKKRAEAEGPEKASQCKNVGEWAWWLDQHELAAEGGEKARLLYVALTRAEEALIVGVPVSSSDAYLSNLAIGFLGAFPELDGLEAGEWQIEVAPQMPVMNEFRVPDGVGGIRYERTEAEVGPGVARVVTLARRGKGKDDPWDASSAGTLEGFDGELPSSVSMIPLLGTELSGEGISQGEPFTLYKIEAPKLRTNGWRAREGVFSYSSAHTLMEERRKAEQAAVGVEMDEARGDTEEAVARELSSQRPTLPPKAQQEAEAEGNAYTPDADKATNLGSAFHELAQTMIETGRDYDENRLEALARFWNLTERQRRRLHEAIDRWERSEVRREALSYDLVRPEVPFFIQVDSQYGTYVEGAIDLLCVNRGSDEALVVDYKTGDAGLSFEEVLDRHEMQANFYAHVMMSQGYKRVSCAFVCVERDCGDGEPIVARYEFDEGHLPRI